MEAIEKDKPEFSGLIREIENSVADVKAIVKQHRPSIMNERYYTGEELCERFHLSKRTLQNYRDEGIIPFTKIGEKILYRDSDINRILEKNYISEIRH